MKTITVNGRAYDVHRLVGQGEHSYTFQVSDHDIPTRRYSLKQMVYTPGKLHRVGQHVREDIEDYRRLCELGIRVPGMMDVDIERERILKEYIQGPSVYELVMADQMQPEYVEQARTMAGQLRRHHIDIDWFPSNFVVNDGKLFYVDYHCHDYDETRDFERVGLPYWSKGPELLAYVADHPVIRQTV